MDNPQIENLIVLAADTSPLARQRLSDHIAGLCLTSACDLTPEEKEIAGHILIRISREFENDVRAHLARKLAASHNAPKELILALALDEVSVAAPVIAHSPLLGEQDLISIVTGKTREHRLRVAMRSGITAAVSNVLVQSAEPDVLEGLVNNRSAAISEAAMQYLVAESKSLENLRGPLIGRADLPDALAQKMLSFVSISLKQQILSKFAIDQDAVDAALRDIDSAPAIAAPSEGVNSKARALIASMHAGGELNVNQAIGFLREKRLGLFLEAMAALSGLDTRAVSNLAYEGEGQGIAVICRAIAMDRSQFATIILLLERSRTGKAVPAARLQAICRLFDSMPVDRAVATLADWRGRAELKQAAC